ncbi:MAG TPA: hypothetical protein VLT91_08660 [Rhizomicrobium sp.]|nr:hypothetical protein [Rhizomicrobium sp.]
MSNFAKTVFGALIALLFSSGAFACDYCYGSYYGGREVYSCNAGQYDCRYESSLYIPRVGDCGYGCHGYYSRYWDDGCGCYRARVHAYNRGFRHGYRVGFHDGYEIASYGDDDGFYDDGHKWHRWERWHDGDGHWRDGWHDDKGGWHDRERHDDHGGWQDGDRHDDHDWHDDGHGDHHDGDHHDDHP